MIAKFLQKKELCNKYLNTKKFKTIQKLNFIHFNLKIFLKVQFYIQKFYIGCQKFGGISGSKIVRKNSEIIYPFLERHGWKFLKIQNKNKDFHNLTLKFWWTIKLVLSAKLSLGDQNEYRIFHNSTLENFLRIAKKWTIFTLKINK